MKKKLKDVWYQVKKSGVALSMALFVVSVAQVSTQGCLLFILGQEDAPEEVL